MAKLMQSRTDARGKTTDKQERSRRDSLMSAGSGTPWEDRGSQGFLAAFFRTCWMSSVSPVRLFDSIRRPETDNDARWFAASCGAAWGISAIIHSILLLRTYQNQPNIYVVNTTLYFIGAGLLLVTAPMAIVLLVKFTAGIYFKMVAYEMKNQAPPVLVFNVLGYTLGPSIFALIPLAGPPLALLGILILMIVAGIKRLHLSVGGAIISAVISLLAAVAVAAGAFFAAYFLWGLATGGAVQVYPPSEIPERR